MIQALAMNYHTAGYGEKGTIEEDMAAILNGEPVFYKYGRINRANVQAKFRTLVSEHRVAARDDKRVSGKRTGDSEELWEAMHEIVQEMDHAAAAKGEGDAAAAANEARKNVRAEKVRWKPVTIF